MDRPALFNIDPFLLPTCETCDGRLSLAHIMPATDLEAERHVYRCSECGAQHVRTSSATTK